MLPGPSQVCRALCQPLGSAALVIVAGQTDDPRGADRLLAHPISVRMTRLVLRTVLGAWPILIYWAMATGEDHPVVQRSRHIIALSLTCITITRYVDTPVRSWTWPGTSTRRTWIVVSACLAVSFWSRFTGVAGCDRTSRAPPRISVSTTRSARPQPWGAVLYGNRQPQFPIRLVLMSSRCCGECATEELASDLHTDTCWEVENFTNCHAPSGGDGELTPPAIPRRDQTLTEALRLDLYAILGPACGLGLYPDDHVGCEDISEERLRYLLEADVETVMLVGTTTYADGRPERIPITPII